jgi:hypothetical protein
MAVMRYPDWTKNIWTQIQAVVIVGWFASGDSAMAA